MLSVSVEESHHNVIAAVNGKSQVLDAALCFLLCKILENSVFLVQILLDVQLADIVEQIKVKVINLLNS